MRRASKKFADLQQVANHYVAPAQQKQNLTPRNLVYEPVLDGEFLSSDVNRLLEENHIVVRDTPLDNSPRSGAPRVWIPEGRNDAATTSEVLFRSH